MRGHSFFWKKTWSKNTWKPYCNRETTKIYFIKFQAQETLKKKNYLKTYPFKVLQIYALTRRNLGLTTTLNIFFIITADGGRIRWSEREGVTSSSHFLSHFYRGNPSWKTLKNQKSKNKEYLYYTEEHAGPSSGWFYLASSLTEFLPRTKFYENLSSLRRQLFQLVLPRIKFLKKAMGSGSILRASSLHDFWRKILLFKNSDILKKRLSRWNKNIFHYFKWSFIESNKTIFFGWWDSL